MVDSVLINRFGGASMTPDGKAFNMPAWRDMHVHFRQGHDLMRTLLREHWRNGCDTVLCMPNTKPVVGRVEGIDGPPALMDMWSVEDYRRQLMAAGANAFAHVVMVMYLTTYTTPALVRAALAAARAGGYVQAFKYYPPHGTTGTDHDFGIPLSGLMDNGVITAIEDGDGVLCVHGEMHGLDDDRWFGEEENAESIFYRTVMPELVRRFSSLRVVCEHISTRTAVRFVQCTPDNVVATVCPQHLLFTTGNLLKNWWAHLMCMPLVKHARDRNALRRAVTGEYNRKFFCGTDSAPHAHRMKHTDCGCAAGCYTGNCALELYAMAFEAAGVNLTTPSGKQAFTRFMCELGPAFYGLEVDMTPRVRLTKVPRTVAPLVTADGTEIIPLPCGLEKEGTDWRGRTSAISWTAERLPPVA